MSELFPNQYWGMEIWKHKELPILESQDFNFFRCIEFKESLYGKMISELHSDNWAYDDGSSFIPTVYPADYLRIIDGIHFGFDRILKKVGNHEKLSEEERDFIHRIALEEPDCLAYTSEARKGGICFLFFEHGFKKLSLREVSLRLGDYPGKNCATIPCAVTSDFTPVLESYGYYFLPIAKRSIMRNTKIQMNMY